jgi:hypothetical protein
MTFTHPGKSGKRAGGHFSAAITLLLLRMTPNRWYDRRHDSLYCLNDWIRPH